MPQEPRVDRTGWPTGMNSDVAKEIAEKYSDDQARDESGRFAGGGGGGGCGSGEGGGGKSAGAHLKEADSRQAIGVMERIRDGLKERVQEKDRPIDSDAYLAAQSRFSTAERRMAGLDRAATGTTPNHPMLAGRREARAIGQQVREEAWHALAAIDRARGLG